MKRLCKIISALLLLSACATLSAQPSSHPLTNVQMSGADNQVKSGGTLTIKSGGTLTVEGGGTVTGMQATDATLTAIAGQTTAANKLTYWDGVDDAATIDFPAVSQALVQLTTAAAWRNAIFPTTAAEGDLITHDGTNWIRMAIGTIGQVPTVQGDGSWAWATPSTAVEAGDVTYDNAASGLAATDVQDAIDEVVAESVALTGAQTITGAKTMTSPIFVSDITLANGSSPTTSTVAKVAFDTDAHAASRGAVQVYDGTANTYLVGVQASDTPSNGQVPTWNTGGTITWEAAAGGGSGLFVGRSAKTSTYGVVVGDKGCLIDCTTSTFPVTFAPAATLGDGFFVGIINSGTGTITLDPNGSETIRDVAGTSTTKTLTRGDFVVIYCSGTEFYVVGSSNDFSGAATAIATPKAVSITNATASSSTSTGALIVTGGAGFGGTVYTNTIGSTATLTLAPSSDTTTAAVFNVTNATDATSIITGAVKITGGLSARKNIIRGAGSAGIGANVPGIVYQSATSTASQANTSENDLKSQTVDGALLATNGDRLCYTATFTLAANGTDKRIRIKYGATTMYDSGAVAANAGTVFITAIVTRTGATTQDYVVTVQSSNATMPSTVTSGTAAETLSGSVIFKATSQQGSGAAVNDVVQKGVCFEFIPAI